MIDRSKQKIRKEREIDCDTSKLYGSIDRAIAYLTEMRAKHGDKIQLDEHWTGYEDMTMRFVYNEMETDEEFKDRQAQIKRLEKYEAEDRKRKEAKEKRRKQYMDLKREFG